MLGVWRTIQAGTAARWEWFKERAQTKHARMWLATYSFFETLILPFPTDPFLAIMVHADRKRVVWLTVLTVLSSVVGAAVAYFLSLVAFDLLIAPLASKIGMEQDIAHASEALNQFTFLATFLGAFTPIPFNPVVYAAGFLKVNFFSFILGALVGRTLRYALASAVTYFFGVAVLSRLEKLATQTTIAIVALVCIVAILFIVL
jgi:membrane protein YqaA with SNARE-associated domain